MYDNQHSYHIIGKDCGYFTKLFKRDYVVSITNNLEFQEGHALEDLISLLLRHNMMVSRIYIITTECDNHYNRTQFISDKIALCHPQSFSLILEYNNHEIKVMFSCDNIFSRI